MHKKSQQEIHQEIIIQIRRAEELMNQGAQPFLEWLQQQPKERFIDKDMIIEYMYDMGVPNFDRCHIADIPTYCINHPDDKRQNYTQKRTVSLWVRQVWEEKKKAFLMKSLMQEDKQKSLETKLRDTVRNYL